MTDPVSVIVGFVSGAQTVAAFEQQLYTDSDLEVLLVAAPAPRNSPFGQTLYHHLIALDYGDPRQVQMAHSSLAAYLSARGVDFTATPEPSQLLQLLAAAQPRWLDADPKYLSTLLSEAPTLRGNDLKAWLRQRILQLFRYAARPPRWIQPPAWPVGPNGPLVFLGQFTVRDYFHDEANVYVFHDPSDGSCTTVIQVF